MLCRAWQLSNQGPIGVNKQQGFACAVPRVPLGFIPEQTSSALTSAAERARATACVSANPIIEPTITVPTTTPCGSRKKAHCLAPTIKSRTLEHKSLVNQSSSSPVVGRAPEHPPARSDATLGSSGPHTHCDQSPYPTNLWKKGAWPQEDHGDDDEAELEDRVLPKTDGWKDLPIRIPTVQCQKCEP